MKTTETPIHGLKLIKPKVFKDKRGFFFESYNEDRYFDIGLDYNFVQDNLSGSVQNTLRGLHYQIGDHSQGKLCQVIMGKVLDVAVDIRFGSPTFGKYYSVELSDENRFQLWIPPGFAHGFVVVSDYAIFSYKCTALYDKNSERTILWNDPKININWGIANPIISEKDKEGKKFSDIEQDFVYK